MFIGPGPIYNAHIYVFIIATSLHAFGIYKVKVLNYEHVTLK